MYGLAAEAEAMVAVVHIKLMEGQAVSLLQKQLILKPDVNIEYVQAAVAPVLIMLATVVV